MPSSSWHLIHGNPEAPARQEASAAAPAVESGTATVLRGHSKVPTRQNAGIASAAAAAALAGGAVGAGMDSSAFAEHIRAAEKAAEERGYEAGRKRAQEHGLPLPADPAGDEP